MATQNIPIHGTLSFHGSVAGSATLGGQAYAGTATLLLPNELPSAGQVLTAQLVSGFVATLGWTTPTAPPSGVTSLNALTGALSLTSIDTSVTITPSGSSIDLHVAGGSGAVSSVFGRTAAVTAQSGDYAAYYVPLTSSAGTGINDTSSVGIGIIENGSGAVNIASPTGELILLGDNTTDPQLILQSENAGLSVDHSGNLSLYTYGGTTSVTLTALQNKVALTNAPAASDNSSAVATTSFVKAQGYALLASPSFTGTVSITGGADLADFTVSGAGGPTLQIVPDTTIGANALDLVFSDAAGDSAFLSSWSFSVDAQSGGTISFNASGKPGLVLTGASGGGNIQDWYVYGGSLPAVSIDRMGLAVFTAGANIAGTTSLTDVIISGTLIDSASPPSAGGSGQLLSSTGTGIAWIDAPDLSIYAPSASPSFTGTVTLPATVNSANSGLNITDNSTSGISITENSTSTGGITISASATGINGVAIRADSGTVYVSGGTAVSIDAAGIVSPLVSGTVNIGTSVAGETVSIGSSSSGGIIVDGGSGGITIDAASGSVNIGTVHSGEAIYIGSSNAGGIGINGANGISVTDSSPSSGISITENNDGGISIINHGTGGISIYDNSTRGMYIDNAGIPSPPTPGAVNIGTLYAGETVNIGSTIAGAITVTGADGIAIADTSGNGINITESGALTGTVNVDSSGLVVTWVSGSQFVESMAGYYITIDNAPWGAPYQISSVDSPTQLTLWAPISPAPASGVPYSYGVGITVSDQSSNGINILESGQGGLYIATQNGEYYFDSAQNSDDGVQTGMLLATQNARIQIDATGNIILAPAGPPYGPQQQVQIIGPLDLNGVEINATPPSEVGQVLTYTGMVSSPPIPEAGWVAPLSLYDSAGDSPAAGDNHIASGTIPFIASPPAISAVVLSGASAFATTNYVVQLAYVGAPGGVGTGLLYVTDQTTDGFTINSTDPTDSTSTVAWTAIGY